VGSNGVTALGAPPKVWTEAERQAILEQLERMLATPRFSHSKRYPALLRYVVERALAGHSDQIKERTLGVEVFGRAPDYDTNQDPVVRTAAGEIRKRIAQYYHEPGHQDEIGIELPPGSYVPEVHMPRERPSAVAATAVAPLIVSTPLPARSSWSRPTWFLIPAAAVIGIALILAAWFKPWTPHSALDRFWAPILDSPSSVLLCVGQPHFAIFHGVAVPVLASWRDPTDNIVAPENQVSLDELYLRGKHYISLWDSMTVTRLGTLLAAKGKPYRIQGELTTSLSDLRDGPAVLVGGFNNDWTLRLTGPLRFSFVSPAEHTLGIHDLQNPSRDAWTVNTQVPYLKQSDDYALISRVRDATTDRYVVVAAGVGYWGTIAAGEFLTDPKYIEDLAKNAPSDWNRKNMQIVIGTRVIAGNSAPPRVLATYFW
jgi:hypothetical protein